MRNCRNFLHKGERSDRATREGDFFLLSLQGKDRGRKNNAQALEEKRQKTPYLRDDGRVTGFGVFGGAGASEKKPHEPPVHRTFVLVRRAGDAWIPLRQFSSQSPRNVALKVASKLPSGSLVTVQDPVTGRVHEYRTVIDPIPPEKRSAIQIQRNITTKSKVYKKAQYDCPPCSEAVRRERGGGCSGQSSTQSANREISVQTDSSSDGEDSDGSGETTDDSDAPDDDDGTQIAFAEFLRQRRRRQRDASEQFEVAQEAEEAAFFAAEDPRMPGQKRKR